MKSVKSPPPPQLFDAPSDLSWWPTKNCPRNVRERAGMASAYVDESDSEFHENSERYRPLIVQAVRLQLLFASLDTF